MKQIDEIKALITKLTECKEEAERIGRKEVVKLIQFAIFETGMELLKFL